MRRPYQIMDGSSHEPRGPLEPHTYLCVHVRTSAAGWAFILPRPTTRPRCAAENARSGPSISTHLRSCEWGLDRPMWRLSKYSAMELVEVMDI